jgi:pimeloyl-ACP methyl ester carboxylesterase
MMEQNFIDIEGTRLFYNEKNNEAMQTIFFVHGNSSSHHTWTKQFSSALLSQYRLVAFDLPAHGLSGEASAITDGYSLPGIGNMMAKATKSLIDGKPYLLAGVSLGTNVIAEMLPYLDQPDQPVGLTLASPSVISTVADLQKVSLPNPNSGILFRDEASVEEIRKLVTDYFFIPDNGTINISVEDFISVKAPFRSLLFKNVPKVIDEIAALKQSGIPLLIVFGKDDKNVNPDYLDDVDLFLSKNQLFKLQNACHFVHVDQPDVFNKLLSEYAADRFTPEHS